MLRPKVLVFMLPLLLPIGQPRMSATGLTGAGAEPLATQPAALKTTKSASDLADGWRQSADAD